MNKRTGLTAIVVRLQNVQFPRFLFKRASRYMNQVVAPLRRKTRKISMKSLHTMGRDPGELALWNIESQSCYLLTFSIKVYHNKAVTQKTQEALKLNKSQTYKVAELHTAFPRAANVKCWVFRPFVIRKNMCVYIFMYDITYNLRHLTSWHQLSCFKQIK